MWPGGSRKKLTALGRHWANGGQGGSSLEEDAAAFGLALDVVAEYREPENVEIWPEHVGAFDVFLACDNQWRIVTGMGGVHHQGLDLGSLEVAMEVCGVADRRGCLEQVRHIERGAKEVLNA